MYFKAGLEVLCLLNINFSFTNRDDDQRIFLLDFAIKFIT